MRSCCGSPNPVLPVEVSRCPQCDTKGFAVECLTVKASLTESALRSVREGPYRSGRSCRRARVLERMNLVGKLLPDGAVPTLGPDATGVGHVFWYTVESPTLSLRELCSVQDWFIRYQLNAVPGVVEVASVGGHEQQYQIEVEHNVAPVIDAIKNSVAATANRMNRAIRLASSWRTGHKTHVSLSRLL